MTMNLLYPIVTGIILATFTNKCFSGNDLFTLDKNIKVITPTKLLQSLHDTPASVTIISKSDIKRLGIKDIPELMRLVPGMSVGRTRGNDYQLAYSNPSVRATRRLQVLIDGMSIYRLGYSTVYWQTLPVNILDIERIEVTRSPSSSTYGVNSFEAAINIITKHPDDDKKVNIEAYKGSIETKNTYASYGDKFNDTSYRIALAHQKNSGYDETENAGEDRRDNTDVASLYLKSTTKFDDSSLQLQLSFVDSTLGHNNSDPGRITTSDLNDESYTANLNYLLDLSENHSVKIHSDLIYNNHTENWGTCYPGLLFTKNLRALYVQNSDYANSIIRGSVPSGGSSSDDALVNAVFDDINSLGDAAINNVCGTVNEDAKEIRSNISIEDTFIFNDSLRTVSGLWIYYNEVDSETFLNGEESYVTSYVFSNWEYKFSDFVLNTGVMVENEQQYNNETLISPRIALNYHLTPNDTVRLIFSKSNRSPDLFETTGNWSYFMRNITPTIEGNSEAYFIFQAAAKNKLTSEKITSEEISYYGVFPSIKTSIDIKLFRLDMTDLLSKKLSFFDFDQTNENSATRKGAELELHMKGSEKLQFTLGYSHLSCSGTHVFEDNTLCAHNSGFSNITYQLDKELNTTLAYYASSNISGFQYHRTDLIINKIFDMSTYNIDLS